MGPPVTNRVLPLRYYVKFPSAGSSRPHFSGDANEAQQPTERTTIHEPTGFGFARSEVVFNVTSFVSFCFVSIQFTLRALHMLFTAMSSGLSLATKLARREEGATLVECGLLLLLIAILCISVTTVFGSHVKDLFVPSLDAL
jgi:Flp pilus assembly pilin Flp